MGSADVLILDNQIENNELLQEYIGMFCKDVKNIFCCTTIDEAVLCFLKNKPEILFLDIELDNGETSFDFLNRIPVKDAQIIFITSHKDYALKAINEVSAAAYLIKPLKPEQLVSALDKAMSNLVKKETVVIEPNFQNTTNYDVLGISLKDRVILMKQKEIVYVEADGKYTNFFLEDKTHFRSSKNIGEYEHLLDPSAYFRIHYKYIVNLNHVTKIDKSAGNYCEFKGYKSLPVSKRRQKELFEFLNLRKRL